ncbi:MarR family transcriptional regulator [Sphingomonas suaedae]|uniref:MarR family transcriptional regulator n=1 Tax=Sphingomonas suaedae TaxID=2599297 RepID=A0A518RBJ9_9SPHN|nr:MarR family transcriptional regulator [Sphingomonas suaedae]QDX24852.1 MarR family transcriptional regulator [Sphingomonas suaedae]
MNEPLGFLVADLARLLRRDFDLRAREIGVTNAQWRTLKTLARHEGSNQGALAELLEVEPITLARMLDRLEDAGLVERRRDPADRRAWRIHLTDAAQPLIGQLRDIADELVEDALAGISEADRAQMRRTLDRVRTNLITTNDNQEAANG